MSRIAIAPALREAARAATLLALAASLLLVIPPPANAASPHLAWARPDVTHLRIDLTGGQATRAWRVDVTGSGAAAGRTMRVELNAGAAGWTGRVSVIERRGSRTVVLSTMSLRGFIRNGTAIFAVREPILHVSFDSASVVAPRNGNGLMRLTFGISIGSRHVVSGSTRSGGPDSLARGPWLAVGAFRC